ncbi:hypothetical protein, partial [Herbaspirillum huttiense]|uniref:hypothetical protein n=1 Tax=Herbaspirillum huttiense TaxID=863372 RepID=UPI003B3AED9A
MVPTLALAGHRDGGSRIGELQRIVLLSLHFRLSPCECHATSARPCRFRSRPEVLLRGVMVPGPVRGYNLSPQNKQRDLTDENL